MGRVAIPAPERFWPKVQKTDTCWLWQGRTTPTGYGMFRLDRDHLSYMVHRFAYEQIVGPIPDGLHIDHLCRVRNCVNPAHLEPVTPLENNLRSVPFRPVKTHCRHGHEFTGDNVAINRSSGKRYCKPCHNARSSRAHRPNWRDAGRSTIGSS